MQRDIDEWRRPWPSGDDEDRGAVGRVSRVLRPTPSMLHRGAGPAGEGDGDRVVRTVPVRTGEDATKGTVAGGAPEGEESFGRIGGAPEGDRTQQPTLPTPLTPAPGRPPTDQGRARLRPLRRTFVATVLLAALFGGVLGAGGALVAADRYDLFAADEAADPGRSAEDDAVRSPVIESVAPEAGQSTVAAVAAAVLPSVVRIDVLAEEDDPDLGTTNVQVGVGSGVIYRSDGYLLTNDHVVREADALEVQFRDGTKSVAEVVGTDRLTDLAVLRVDRVGLPAINLRQDQRLEVGETAIAIGSPFGLDASVTAGVVSALNRDLDVPGDGDGAFVIAALIQTDAAINPGNSGGALVDTSGQLIGINTAILTGSGGSQGVGFAIPTHAAVTAAEQLIERGFVSHPFLGISGLDVTNEVEVRYRDDHGIELEGGALVDTVVEGSAAAQGDIEPGDVIIELAGEPITSMTDVIATILRFEPGDVVDVVTLRAGERLELEVELGERPR